MSLPRWAYPVITLVLLSAIFPQVRQWDKERKVEVAVSDMKLDHKLENLTDGRADEVGLLETKINDLLNSGGESISLSRTGNIRYTAKVDGDLYVANFFISAVDYSIHNFAITGTCKGKDCVTITKNGTFSDKSIQTGQVSIPLQSNEQGNKLIELLSQYESICSEDTKIQRGWRRKVKRLFDKIV